ncbi:MAG: type I glyceraldehyde-3-phosphate dehydrogenase, partial [bacterium]|nr:type I glyceraldehyde-3-phosphate dehydrogenase [bacterium]
VVSIVDFICIVKQETSVEQINNAFRMAAQGGLKNILAAEDGQLVSMDFKGNPNSAIVDLPLTMANGNLIKVVGWYDNEWGYSNRLVEMAELVGSKL